MILLAWPVEVSISIHNPCPTTIGAANLLNHIIGSWLFAMGCSARPGQRGRPARRRLASGSGSRLAGGLWPVASIVAQSACLQAPYSQ